MYIFSRIVMHQVSCRSVYIALSMTSVHCENSRLCVGRSCMWCGWTSKGAGPKSSSAATGCLGPEICARCFCCVSARHHGATAASMGGCGLDCTGCYSTRHLIAGPGLRMNCPWAEQAAWTRSQRQAASSCGALRMATTSHQNPKSKCGHEGNCRRPEAFPRLRNHWSQASKK